MWEMHSLGMSLVLALLCVSVAVAQETPVTTLKRLRTQTELMRDGQPMASIVLPTDLAGQQAARDLQAAVRARTGCALPLVPDAEAWETLWGKTNLIVIGNLMTSKVFAMLYCMHYACSDGAWPGPGGYELRTICDPRGLGYNVVALGGSDAAGVRAAVEALIARVPSYGTWALDYTIDTRIDGKPYVPLTDQELASASTDKITQTVNYYRTGNPQYAELAKRGFLAFKEQMDASGIMRYTSGYDWIGICWDLLEEAPCISDDERLTITNGLVTFMEKSPGSWAPIKDQPYPYHGVDMVTVHSYDTARYFEDHYPDLEVARRIMDRERAYWPVQERYWTQDCQASHYQGADGAYLVQYAVQALDFDWFESANFRKWLEWYWSSCDNMGYQTGYGDAGWGSVHSYASWAVQVGAWYYGEGWMQWMADRNNLPRRGGLNLGHSFYTGEATPEPPLHLGGLYKVPLDTWMHDYGGKPEWGPERCFNKISIQDGYTPGAPYLLLDGTGSFPHGHPATNQIVCYTANGHYWLVSGGYMVFPTVEHNVMGVYRDGQGGRVPRLAELTHLAELPGGKFVQSVLRDYGGVDWTRSILWRDGGTVVAIDRATAKEAGSYGLQLVWRCYADAVDQASRHVAVPARSGDTDLGTFHLYNADTSTLGVKDTAVDGLNALYQSTARDLEPGESYTYRNLFLVEPPGDSVDRSLAPLGDGATVISEGGRASAAGVGPLDAEGITTDAAMFWLSGDRISLVDATYFTAPGMRVSATGVVSLTLDIVTGEVTFARPPTAPVKVTVVAGGSAVVETIAPGGGPPVTRTLRATSFISGWRAALARLCAGDRSSRPGKEAAGAGASAPTAPLEVAWQIESGQFSSFGNSVPEGPAPGANMVRVANVTGDGAPEALVCRTDGRLYCVGPDGSILWAFQAPAQVWDACAGDVDGDGKAEVAFVCATSAASGQDSFLFLLDSQGKERWRAACPGSFWNWQLTGVSTPRSSGSTGALLLCWIGDLDGDGNAEIGCASRNFFAYIFDAEGNELWEVMTPYHRPLAWEMADLDGDGVEEFIVATDFNTVAYHGDPATVPGAWQPESGQIGSGDGSFSIDAAGPALDVAELPGDGRKWIINGTRNGAVVATPYTKGATSGSPAWSYNTGATVDTVTVATLDGQPRVLAGSRSMSVYCLDADGKLVWTRGLGEMVRAISARDLDGDGEPEILVGCDDGRIYQLSAAGEILGSLELGSAVRALAPAGPNAAHDLLATTWDGRLVALRWRR